MGNNWPIVPRINNMNRLQFQHLGFVVKLVYGVVLMIFHLDHVRISLAKCFVGMWFFAEQSLVLLKVQHVLDLVWTLID
jgi:hypothetical protein